MGRKDKAGAIPWYARLGRAFGPDSPSSRIGLTIAIVAASLVIVLITS
jgi:hypothetical protein